MGALLLAALALFGETTDKHHRRRADAEQREPPMGVEVAAAAHVCEAGGCRTEVFFRPIDCEVQKHLPTRNVMRCRAEERMEVSIGPGGVADTKALDDGPARNPYPWEFVGQWRRCPFAEDAELERAGVAYEDPEVGRCTVLRDASAAALPAGRGLGMLKGLHPYLAEAARRMIAAAHARGDEIKVISGNRLPKKVTVWVTRTVKHEGKPKEVKVQRTRYSGGGWHGFGLAIDVNLMHRKDLSSATAAFLEGPPERDEWLRLGEHGESLGLKWLGRTKPGEIFHFEWHPTWPGLPKGKLYRKLARRGDRKGLPAVWELLRYDPTRPSPFKHLQDH